MEQLHTLNDRRDIASNEMVVFVVMNTASLQLLPTTLAALRQSYGSSAPFVNYRSRLDKLCVCVDGGIADCLYAEYQARQNLRNVVNKWNL